MKKCLLIFFLFSVSGFTCFSQVQLDKGLVAYYPFNGNAKDESKNGNDAYITKVNFTADRLGKPNAACSFDGKKQYIRIPDNPSLHFDNGFSISAWVSVNDFYEGTCHGNRIIMKGNTDYLQGNYFLTFDDNHSSKGGNCATRFPDKARQSFYGAMAPPVTNDYIVPGKWYMLTYVYDGAIASLYVDCKLQGQSKIKNYKFSNNYDLFFGKMNNDQYPYWFAGLLDEVRIYNRPLNTDEINTLCNKKTDDPVVRCTGSNIVSAKFGYTEFNCTSATFELTNANPDNIQSIKWKFSDGTQDNWLNPVHNFNKPGKYKITAIVTSKAKCIDTFTRQIELKGLTSEFSFTEQDKPGQIQFKTKNNNASYSWDMGDGKTYKNESVVSHQYRQSGDYTIRLYSRNHSGCTDTVQKKISVSVPVIIKEENAINVPAPPVMPVSTVQLEKREKDVVREIEVQRDSIHILLYDNGVIDGDSITLIFNGQVIAARQMLKAKPLSYSLKIERGKSNELTMYAENLGSIPPNTALLIINDGEDRYELNLSSTKNSNGVVVFRLKE